jgi:hypothetical protein
LTAQLLVQTGTTPHTKNNKQETRQKTKISPLFFSGGIFSFITRREEAHMKILLVKGKNKNKSEE